MYSPVYIIYNCDGDKIIPNRSVCWSAYSINMKIDNISLQCKLCHS